MIDSPQDRSVAHDALLAEREATLARIGSMEADFEAIVAGAVDSNADDEHDPEGSTIAYDRAQTAALLGEARTYLGDLDRAFERLDSGRYTVCDVCGTQIASERLAARPAARTCIRCASSPGPN